MITLDFETRSLLTLRARGTQRSCGIYRYAKHPSTEIICLAYKLDSNEPTLWTPDDRYPLWLYERVLNGEELHAHNAAFERQIWNEIMVKRYGAPEAEDHQWVCSAAQGAALAYPRSLEELGVALNLKKRKDKTGHAVMLQLSRPRKPSKNNSDQFCTKEKYPEKFQQTYEYCIDDVKSEVEAIGRMPELTKSERRVWLLDQRINDRGVPMDRESIENAIAINEDVERQLLEELATITNNEITTGKQRDRILHFVNVRGVNIDNLQAQTIRDLFDSGEVIDSLAERVLRIRQELGLSSISKYETMLEWMDDDDRIRGTVMYHGASTGRWTGKGPQTLNLPSRNLLVSKPEDIEHTIKLMRTRNGRSIELMYGLVGKVLSAMIRPMIKAPAGKRLIIADFSQIECRITAWLAGQLDLLELFRSGKDPYKNLASRIYEKPVDDVTSDERFIGKTGILGLGYQMGRPERFQSTCAMMGVHIEEEFAERVIKTYRETYTDIVNLWYDVERAAIEAVETGKAQSGRLRFYCTKETLYMKLPSERCIAYQRPWIERTKIFLVLNRETGKRISRHSTRVAAEKAAAEVDGDVWPVTEKKLRFWAADATTGKWTRDSTYGGKLVENASQAISRDFLVGAMFRVEEAGYPIILTVYDEIVIEREIGKGRLGHVIELMTVVPKWGRGCPVAAEGFESERYRK